MEPRFLSFYRELTEAQSEAEKTLVPPRNPISKEAAVLRTEAGLPLLSFGDLAADSVSLQKSSALIAAVFHKYRDVVGDILPSVPGDDRREGPDLATAEAWFNGKPIPEMRYLPIRLITKENVEQYLPAQW